MPLRLSQIRGGSRRDAVVVHLMLRFARSGLADQVGTARDHLVGVFPGEQRVTAADLHFADQMPPEPVAHVEAREVHAADERRVVPQPVETVRPSGLVAGQRRRVIPHANPAGIAPGHE